MTHEPVNMNSLGAPVDPVGLLDSGGRLVNSERGASLRAGARAEDFEGRKTSFQDVLKQRFEHPDDRTELSDEALDQDHVSPRFDTAGFEDAQKMHPLLSNIEMMKAQISNLSRDKGRDSSKPSVIPYSQGFGHEKRVSFSPVIPAGSSPGTPSPEAPSFGSRISRFTDDVLGRSLMEGIALG